MQAKVHRQVLRSAALAAITLGLAGCGGGEVEQAVDACAKAIADKLGSDRNYRIDRGDMAAKAKREGEDVVHIQSQIVFDAGLPREYTQMLDCKARFGAGSTPDVISLNFIW